MILPSTPVLIAGAALAALIAGFGGGWQWRSAMAERDVAEIHSAQALALAKATEDARAAERSIHNKQSEAVNAAAAKQLAHRAAERAAAVAGDGLRFAAATVAARCPSDPATVAAGQDAASPARVLADVLADVERVGRAMATTADERGIAIAACVGSYEALRTTP